MNTFAELKIVLGDTAEAAVKTLTFSDNEDLRKINSRAVTLFKSPKPMYGRRNGKLVNITRLSMNRLSRYMKRQGIKWKELDWISIQKWLADNWEKVLKILLPLLLMLIL